MNEWNYKQRVLNKHSQWNACHLLDISIKQILFENKMHEEVIHNYTSSSAIINFTLLISHLTHKGPELVKWPYFFIFINETTKLQWEGQWYKWENYIDILFVKKINRQKKQFSSTKKKHQRSDREAWRHVRWRFVREDGSNDPQGLLDPVSEGVRILGIENGTIVLVFTTLLKC